MVLLNLVTTVRVAAELMAATCCDAGDLARQRRASAWWTGRMGEGGEESVKNAAMLVVDEGQNYD